MPNSKKENSNEIFAVHEAVAERTLKNSSTGEKMSEQFSRTELLIGKENIETLNNSRVAVFGIGGVGGYVVEALARSGVGTLDIIDNDKVCISNINRQIIATWKTIDRDKVDVAEERIHDINPNAVVNKYKIFYMPDTAEQFDFSQYDYVVDAIDTVTGKIRLVEEAVKYNVPIISSMGTGNKMDATAFEVSDIYKTSVCPLAKVMRKELKKRNIDRLKVVYSKEKSMTPISEEGIETGKRKQTPGSNAFVPSVAGLIIAGEVIKDLIK